MAAALYGKLSCSRVLAVQAHRLALPGAAWVDADQVVAGQHLRGEQELADLANGHGGGRARAAEVDEQRADPVGGVGGGQAYQLEPERLSAWAGVVVRHRRVAAATLCCRET